MSTQDVKELLTNPPILVTPAAISQSDLWAMMIGYTIIYTGGALFFCLLMYLMLDLIWRRLKLFALFVQFMKWRYQQRRDIILGDDPPAKDE